MNTRMLWYLAIILFLVGLYYGMVWLQDIQKKTEESNERYMRMLERRVDNISQANRTADLMIKEMK